MYFIKSVVLCKQLLGVIHFTFAFCFKNVTSYLCIVSFRNELYLRHGLLFPLTCLQMIDTLKRVPYNLLSL